MSLRYNLGSVTMQVHCMSQHFVLEECFGGQGPWYNSTIIKLVGTNDTKVTLYCLFISVQRGIYKDLISLLQRDHVLKEKDLKAKVWAPIYLVTFHDNLQARMGLGRLGAQERTLSHLTSNKIITPALADFSAVLGVVGNIFDWHNAAGYVNI